MHYRKLINFLSQDKLTQINSQIDTSLDTAVLIFEYNNLIADNHQKIHELKAQGFRLCIATETDQPNAMEIAENLRRQEIINAFDFILFGQPIDDHKKIMLQDITNAYGTDKNFLFIETNSSNISMANELSIAVPNLQTLYINNDSATKDLDLEVGIRNFLSIITSHHEEMLSPSPSPSPSPRMPLRLISSSSEDDLTFDPNTAFHSYMELSDDLRSFIASNTEEWRRELGSLEPELFWNVYLDNNTPTRLALIGSFAAEQQMLDLNSENTARLSPF